MSTLVGNTVMPGDVLQLGQPESNKKIILGPGLIEDGEIVKITKPGILRFREPAAYWVDCHQKRVGFQFPLTEITQTQISKS